MCGIAGILNLNGRPVEIPQLKLMTDTISHRGPDGEGHWVNSDGRIGLGHRRLSIIDLSSGGSQPMHYAEGRYTITFNGEIYNYVEIKEQLVKKGYIFHSHSDTEVLLALYDLKKEQCLQDLDGMFSFAIWDEKEKELFCARDRFGEKPFFYTQNPNYFAFGSEMKELWNLQGGRTPNFTMVNDYLRYGYISNPQKPEVTFYKDIFQLPAASYLKIKDNKIIIKKYWSIDLQKRSIMSFDDAMESFRELFTQSTSRRLRSDVAVGSSLSGGLDSSLIVCLVSELLKPKGLNINTFSARFKNFAKDEGKYMQYVVDKTHASPHYIFCESDVLNNEIDKIFHHQEEPFGSSSILVQYQVFELAKKNNVTVLLDGQGADEILAGYTPYYQTYFNELSLKSPSLYHEELNYFLDLQDGNTINPPAALVNKRSGFKDKLKQSLPGLVKLNRLIRKRFISDLPIDINMDFYREHKSSPLPTFDYDEFSLNSHLHTHSTVYGLGTLLRYADRNSMAHSREVRLPFLNHELVEFLFSLPAEFKIHNGWTKYLMRKSFENTLPKEIAWRKDKIGYEPPQKEWMSRPEILERVVEARKVLVDKNILDKSILQKTPDPSGANQTGDKSWEHIMVSKLF
jgi:asparagine synthase (glutamine-hydrolysing)